MQCCNSTQNRHAWYEIKTDAKDNRVLPSITSTNGNPPAFNLAELWVGQVDDQGQAGHPHAHLQLGAQETVGKVEHHPLPSCLLPVDIHIVAALGHLDKQRGEVREAA